MEKGARMKSPRYWIVLCLMAAAALLLHLRGDQEIVPRSQPLNGFPAAVGSWTGRDLPIDPEVVSVLGRGEFLSRAYTETGESMPVTLFIGYFPTQRTGQTIHSPKHCLPGAGWTFDSAHYATLSGTDGRPYRVGEYVISNGDARQFVIYWFAAHGRTMASEYEAKARLALDAIRLNRTDGALVRVMTPISPLETSSDARSRAVLFTRQLAPLLSAYVPN
jgi:EpsI family protein